MLFQLKTNLKSILLVCVWYCGARYFLKVFLYGNILKYFFFRFFFIFDISKSKSLKSKKSFNQLKLNFQNTL